MTNDQRMSKFQVLARDCPKTGILGSLSAAFVANFVEFWRKSGVFRQSLRQRLPTKLILRQALTSSLGARVDVWSLVIGISLVIGHCSLVISNVFRIA